MECDNEAIDRLNLDDKDKTRIAYEQLFLGEEQTYK